MRTIQPTYDTDAELLPVNQVLTVPDQQLRGYESIGRSAMRHPVLVALITVLGLVAGSAIGFMHPVTYSADAQLLVGKANAVDVSLEPALAAGVVSLASDYARLATTSSVKDQTAALLHTAKIPGTLSATPIAQSANIQVEGQASTAAEAVAIANAGAAALVKVINAATNASTAQLDDTLKAYKAAEHEAQVDTADANLLQSELNQLTGSIGNNAPTPAQVQAEDHLNAEIASYQTAAGAANLKAQGYSSQYQQDLPPLTAQEQQVQQIGGASSSGSDQRSFLEAAGLAGFVGGLVIGLALAAFVDMRRLRAFTSRSRELATPEL